MFISALYVIAKSWNQPRCPSGNEWINNLWHMQTVEYYSALKKELLKYEKTRRKPQSILLSKRDQPKKSTQCMIPTNDILEKAIIAEMGK